MHTASANKIPHDKKVPCLLLNSLAANNNGNLLRSWLQAQPLWVSSKLGICQLLSLYVASVLASNLGVTLSAPGIPCVCYITISGNKRTRASEFLSLYDKSALVFSLDRGFSRSEGNQEEDMVRCQELEIWTLAGYLMTLQNFNIFRQNNAIVMFFRKHPYVLKIQHEIF